MRNSNKANLPSEQPRLMLFGGENHIGSTKAYIFDQLGSKLFMGECRNSAESNVLCIKRANQIIASIL